MHVVMTPTGSMGDVLPFLALGQSLKARGHNVVVLANEHFQRIVAGADLGFVQVGTQASYTEAIDHPDFWNPRHTGRLILRHAVALMPQTYQAVLEHARSGESVLLCSSLAFGAFMAGEKMNLPRVRLAVEPKELPSAHDPVVTFQMKRIHWIPTWLRRNLPFLGFLLERTLRTPLEAFRKRVGLPPIETSILAWSKALPAIGLFPEWFAPHGTDWSESTWVTGFLQYRQEKVAETPRDLKVFLDDRPSPIIFTVTSFNRHAGDYFSVAVNVSTRIGCRAILLTPHRAQIPENLPENVAHFAYAPHSDVLPRCAALVHNGGIGTLAAALVAGIPQLIVPFIATEPDHAVRLADLGAGDYIAPRNLSVRSLGEKLTSILENETLRRNAQRHSKLIANQDALGATCRLVERLGGV